MDPLWKKVKKHTLIDVATKLEISGVNFGTRKDKLVDIILDRINELGDEIDEQDFPELQIYFNSRSSTRDEKDIKQESEDDEIERERLGYYENMKVDSNAGQDAESDELNEESHNSGSVGYNKLRFDNDGNKSANDTTFEFKFDSYMRDIISNVKRINENVQDYLSTIYTIETIFYAIELYSVLTTYNETPFHQISELAYSSAIWLTFSAIIPSIVAYYINFIRYDLTYVQVDPMIFHITKLLLALFFMMSEQSGIIGATWNANLGLLPLIFSMVGILVTLYIF